ncbi:MAG: hypothetical protein AAF902_19920 [Chloroflexota bacterium]
MDEQMFIAIILGLGLNLILWAYGTWTGLSWFRFFKENYLLPFFLFICGIFTGYVNGETFGSSLLFGLTVAILISLMFGLRLYSEFGVYKPKVSLSLQGIFGQPSRS